jgi:transposase
LRPTYSSKTGRYIAYFRHAPEALIDAYDGVKADNAVLRARVSQSSAREAAAEEKAAQSEAKLAQLSHELEQLKRMLFGVRSERFEPVQPDQTHLFDEPPSPETDAAKEEKQKTTTTTTTRTRRKPARQVLPSHLRREEIIIEPDVDTTGLRRIGSEVTETVDYREARLVVIRRVRPKYVDPKDDSIGVIIGKLPARPIDKGIAEAGLLANVLVEKFLDHLPLYRQLQRFARQGITISPSTIGGWVAQTADLLA